MSRVETGVTALLGMVLVLGALYIIPSGFGPSRANYYGFLGRALLEGRLWIAETPNCPYDTLPFQGKCYLHWGVFPAVLHWIQPWTDRMASIAGALVAGFFLMKTLFHLAGTSASIPVALFLTFGTGLFTAGLCGWVYGESISLAHGFGLMGIYYGLKRKDLLSGVALALACLTRPSWFLVAASFAVLSLLKKRWNFIFPVAAAFGLQAFLNFSRFGNVFDFGNSYYVGHLVGKPDIRWTEGLYSLKAVIPNIFTYFFTGFPPLPFHFPEVTRFFHQNLYIEFPLGLFATMPVLLIAAAKVDRSWFKDRGVLFLCLLPMSLLMLVNTNEIYRYQLEVWLPFLVLLVPPLLRDGRKWIRIVSWVSAAQCLVLTGINTYWVLVTHWEML